MKFTFSVLPRLEDGGVLIFVFLYAIICCKAGTVIASDMGNFNGAQQQQITVSGVVLDEEGKPLPGVNIIEKGVSSNGIATDVDGNFTISVSSASAILTFSYAAYKPQEVPVKAGVLMKIRMEPDTKALEEVVVTGYQEIKSNEFTGAIGKLKMGEIRLGGVNTIDKMLQGQVAGVQVNLTSSVFGTAPKIRIRGSSSITGINEPLWVLDGVVLQQPLNIEPSALYSGSARNLLSSVLGGVNPEDIEDITILKDASATAIYGTKAVNGVIVITTKRAKRNQPLLVSYNSLITMNLKPNINSFNVLNSAEQTDIQEQLYKIYQAQLLNYSARNGGAYTNLLDQRNRRTITENQFYERLRDIKSINTDWFDALFKNSITQQHSVALSYGGENIAGRLSFSYFNDPGYSIGQKVDRYTINSSNRYTFSDKFSAEVLIKYADINQTNPGSRVNPYSYASTASRAMSPNEYYLQDYVPFNIINEIENDNIKVESKNIILQANLNYSPIKKLDINLIMQNSTSLSKVYNNTTENSAYANSFRTTNFQIIQSNDRLYKDPTKSDDALPETTLPLGGFLYVTDAKTSTNTFRAQTTYHAIERDNHQLDAFFGTEIISLASNELQTDGRGYLFASGTPVPSELALSKIIREGNSYYYTPKFNRNQFSLYANVNYFLFNRYSIALSARNDATNVSGTSKRNRFLPTYVLSGAWIVTEEPFMKNIPIISALKLRGSYGLRGNAGNRGPDLRAYYRNAARIYPDYNELVIRVDDPEISDLDFEKEYIANVGVDVSLFKKINITAEFYQRNNFDLVGQRPVPLSSGFSFKTINWARMRNQGIELSIDNTPLNLTRDLTLKLNFNIGFNKNTLLSNYIGNDPTVYTASEINGYPFENRPLTGLYSFKFAGLDSKGLPQYYGAEGEKVYGFLSDERDYRTLEYQGSRDPIYSGGFSGTLAYKGWSLSAIFTYAGGNVIRRPPLYRFDDFSSLYRDDLNIPGDFSDRWQAPGNERYTNIPRLLDDQDTDFYQRLGIFNNQQLVAYNRSNVRTVDASYLRVRNVSLKYAFSQRIVSKMRFKYLNIELQATNLAVFASKRLRGQDPETLLQGTNIPPVRSVSLGINAGF